MKVLAPQSFEELLGLLQERADRCYFRGQACHHWALNSTLARELRGQTAYLPRVYIPKEPLEQWTVQNLYSYHVQIFSCWEPTEELLNHLADKGDPYFEIIRQVQQEKLRPKIHNAIPNHPTPALEFSDSMNIALFFGTDGISCKEEDGAVFCLEKDVTPKEVSFPMALSRISLFGEVVPCEIIPCREVNDLGNPKPKRQEAIYIFQRDLRNPLDHYFPIEKIVIQQSLKVEIQSWLRERGITAEYVYAQDLVR